MGRFVKKLASRVAKGQGGFTLIEMLVVVRIIVVLVAVVDLKSMRYLGSGE